MVFSHHGDVEKGFAEADIIKEFSDTFGGAIRRPDATVRERRQVGRRKS